MANARALLEARLWLQRQYGYKLGTSTETEVDLSVGGPPVPFLPYGNWVEKKPGEKTCDWPQEGLPSPGLCGMPCRMPRAFESGVGNEAGCLETMLCPDAESIEVQRHAADLLNKYALNAWEMVFTLAYVRDLNKKGILGPGLQIDSPLDFSDYGTLPFVQRFLEMAATKKANGQEHPFAVALSEGDFAPHASGVGWKRISRVAISHTRIGASPCTSIRGPHWNGATGPFWAIVM